jgi:formamidopyrimidine-DNA glycosylase
MPELPDITIYIEALAKRIGDQTITSVRIAHPFLLRTADPPISAVDGKRVCELRRIGKRIAIGVEDDIWLVLHLMIAGRLQWREPGAKLRRKLDLAGLDFDEGTLVVTEAGTKKRASLHIVGGRDALDEHDPGGLDVLETDTATFGERLALENHTLKRALTDPRLFSGIGNAYSDEILHRARLSPIAMTQKLLQEEIDRLYDATRLVLHEWVERLRVEAGDGWPDKVTAFRDGMAAHGRYGQPCPVCATPIQRIRYATNETNYCPACQTGGKLLADRVLSRLLKKDWPRTLEELEELKKPRSD